MDLRSVQDARRVSDNKWVKVQGISNLTFVIKPYQRGYRWRKNNAKKLMDDISWYVKHDGNSSELYNYIQATCEYNDKTDIYDFYCLQALSVKKDIERKNTYELIDGQQRLTTLFLIYELLDAFINPKEDRSDHAPYSILYNRDGDNTGDYDFTKSMHEAIPFRINDKNPRKAYREGVNRREEAWFLAYKNALKKAIQKLHTKDRTDSLAIDLYYISEVAEEIVDFIYKYTDDPGKADNLERLFDAIKQDVLFLWYEIPAGINAEDEFSSINSNKIKLTNAELIKALVLKKDKNGQVPENAGHRWEAIEQGLCREELWAFICGEDKATRIDLLLDLYARDNNDSPYSPDQSNEYALFDWYEELSGKKDQTTFSLDVLKGIEEKYDRVCEWYNDVELYHYIGLLTCYRVLKLTKEKNQEELVCEIFSLYKKSKSHDDFVNELKEKIKAYILCNLSKEDFNKEIFEVEGLSYNDTSEQPIMKAILWLLNAWEIIESAENNIIVIKEGKEKKRRKSFLVNRLPFSHINGNLKKANSWTLEHIMPQKPEDNASEDYKSYMELQKEIEKDQKSEGKDDIVVCGEEVHQIGNMALLTRRTNSAIQNGNLDIKRKDIVKMIGDGKYIPGSTTNAFCLYYNQMDENHKDNIIDVKYWTISNRDSYMARINNCLRSHGISTTCEDNQEGEKQ